MNAVIERDADRAVELHTLHLHRTAEMVRAVLRAPPGKLAVALRGSRRAAREDAAPPRRFEPAKRRSLRRQGGH
jgi:hypothetical protein